MSDLTLPGWAAAGASVVGTLVISLLGWFFQRTIRSFEAGLESAVGSLNKQLVDHIERFGRLEAKLDAAAARDTTHSERLVEASVRLHETDRRLGRVEVAVEDLRGFLASMGFRKRDKAPASPDAEVP